MKNLITLLFLFTLNILFAQQVTTLATITSNFGDGMIVTPEGDVLVSGGWNKDNILRIDPNGVVSNFATGLPGPVGMGFDSDENLYVTNYSGNSISKITPSGEVSEFASGLDGPAGLIVNEDDEIFVTLYGANFSGNGQKVLKYQTDGTYETYVSGSGIQDAIGITMDGSGNMYVTNYLGGKVFKIDPDLNISLLATVSDASINQIVYAGGYVYIPCPNLRKIYRVNVENGDLEHFTGTGGNAIIDGDISEAEFHFPNSCAVNGTGTLLYILDSKMGRVRKIDLSTTTSVNETSPILQNFQLRQNMPNPFDSITHINFNLSSSEKVALSVFDLQGKHITTILDKFLSEGDHSITFDGTNLPNGTYIYKLTAGEYSVSKKMILKKE